MFLDNHLPWDSIADIRSKKTDSLLSTQIAVLKKNPAARVSQNHEFEAIKKSCESIKKMREHKVVSLNEEKSYKEYLSQKNIDDINEEIANRQITEENKKDAVLNEAVMIAADFAEICTENSEDKNPAGTADSATAKKVPEPAVF
jgi:hypothetical protein